MTANGWGDGWRRVTSSCIARFPPIIPRDQWSSKCYRPQVNAAQAVVGNRYSFWAPCGSIRRPPLITAPPVHTQTAVAIYIIIIHTEMMRTYLRVFFFPDGYFVGPNRDGDVYIYNACTYVWPARLTFLSSPKSI